MAILDEVLGTAHAASITHTSVLVRELRVRVGVLPQPVTIRVYYEARSEPYTFETSHAMKPGDVSSAQTVPRSAASEAEAVRHAVRMLTEEYECAVRRGELPVDAWLVRN